MKETITKNNENSKFQSKNTQKLMKNIYINRFQSHEAHPAFLIFFFNDKTVKTFQNYHIASLKK